MLFKIVFTEFKLFIILLFIFLVIVFLISLASASPIVLLLLLIFATAYVAYKEAGTKGLTWSAINCFSTILALIPFVGAILYQFVVRKLLIKSLNLEFTPTLNVLDKFYLIIIWIINIIVTVITIMMLIPGVTSPIHFEIKSHVSY